MTAPYRTRPPTFYINEGSRVEAKGLHYLAKFFYVLSTQEKAYERNKNSIFKPNA